MGIPCQTCQLIVGAVSGEIVAKDVYWTYDFYGVANKSKQRNTNYK